MSCQAWPVEYPCDVGEVDAAQLALATSAAESLLWGLTGRVYGVCEADERYSVLTCASSGSRPWPYKSALDGEWRNATCADGCCTVPLAHRPVRSVTSVEVDGVALDPAAYWIARDSLVIGEGCPFCRGCSEPAIHVVYDWGVLPPGTAAGAVGELACEFVKGFSGGACRLSARAVSIARQGVQIDLLDAADLFDQGLTGMPIADAFIRTTNPNRLQRPSRVLSPDLPMRAR